MPDGDGLRKGENAAMKKLEELSSEMMKKKAV